MKITTLNMIKTYISGYYSDYEYTGTEYFYNDFVGYKKRIKE